MQLLHVDTSILDDQSASRQLSRAIVQRLRDSRDGTTVTTYDLVADPVGHLTAAEFFAFQGVVPDAHDAQQAVTRNAAILNDFLSADVIVIGAPMYNFALPSQLRAWLDRLAVPGRTFRYTANGVEGLAAGAWSGCVQGAASGTARRFRPVMHPGCRGSSFGFPCLPSWRTQRQ